MDYLVVNWGSFVSLAGLIVSVVGFVWAVRRAGQARSAARAAEAASVEAREALSRTLGMIDLQRAIDLIQRLKAAHRERRWDAGLELYQILRMMLSNIEASSRAGRGDVVRSIDDAIHRITEIENEVSRLANEGPGAEDVQPFAAFEFLNGLQEDLESIVSNMTYGGEDGR